MPLRKKCKLILTISFFFPTPYQFTAAVAFEAAEDRDTFLIPALLCQMGNVQDSRFVIDGKVKPLHHAVLHENIHEKLIPAPAIPERKYHPDSNALCKSRSRSLHG